MATRYYITLPDGTRARGADPDLSFKAVSADGFASELQAALRTGGRDNVTVIVADAVRPGEYAPGF